MTRPTVRQLEYIVAVAEHRHFGRAANACGVTQPALSIQIRQVEDLLGVQLFERDRKRVLITTAGRELVARSREVLANLDSMSELARGAGEPLSGRVRLGVIPTVAPYLLPRVLPVVRERYPALELLLREDQTARLVEQLGDGSLDVLLLALPVAGANAVEMPLFDERFVLAVPMFHDLHSRANVAESDLEGESVLLLEDGHCLRDHALSVCRAAGAHESDQVRATSLNTLVQMVANGLGITLLPELAVDTEVREGTPIAVRPFRAPVPTRSIGLMWRQSSACGADFRLLGALIEKVARTFRRPPGRARRG